MSISASAAFSASRSCSETMLSNKGIVVITRLYAIYAKGGKSPVRKILYSPPCSGLQEQGPPVPHHQAYTLTHVGWLAALSHQVNFAGDLLHQVANTAVWPLPSS